MKIENIKINGFGKIENKEINFSDKINLIVGKNESGKSMIMAYIRAMFFGLQKTRKKDIIPDEEKYKPWNNHEFSGTITYTLSSGKKHTIFRDFNLNKTTVIDENNNDITSMFELDRNTGPKAFEEQTKLDLKSFDFTMFTMQNAVVLDSEDKSVMVQKLSNLVSTGEDNISYNNIKKKLQDKRREEIGTNKTKNMPINIVEKKILAGKEEIKKILEKATDHTDSTGKEIEIKKAFNEAENKKKLIELLKQQNRTKKINDEMLFSLRQKLTVKKDEVQQKKRSKHDLITPISLFEENKKSFYTITIVGIVLEIILASLRLTVFKNLNTVNTILILSIIPILILLALIITYFKSKAEIDRDIEIRSQENRDIEKEINIIRKDIKEEEKEIEKYEKKKLAEEKMFNEMLIADFCGKLSDKYLNKVIEYDERQLAEEANIAENEYKSNIQQLSTIDAKKAIANKDLEKMAQLEEELDNLEEEKQDLRFLSEVYDIILDELDIAYDKMKESISPSFINNLSKLTNKITGGKYKSILFSESQDILIQLNTGEYIKLEKLSTGTIEQINLALRLSILNELTDENMPIFLDESFVFYDTERLSNIINILNTELNKQVIIFTCSNREKEVLDSHNINYNYIEL